DTAFDPELRTCQARTRWPGRLGNTHELRRPLLFPQKPTPHHERLTPRRRHAVGTRDTHLDAVPRMRLERGKRPVDEHRLTRVQRRGLLTIQSNQRSGLPPIRHIRCHLPTQPRLRRISQRNIATPFDTNITDAGTHLYLTSCWVSP